MPEAPYRGDGEPEFLVPDRGSILHGFLTGAVWNVGGIIASAALMSIMIGIPLVVGFALVQFAWLLPVRARMLKAGKTESAKGVLIVAGITVLLSAGCWYSLSNTRFH